MSPDHIASAFAIDCDFERIERVALNANKKAH